MRSWSLPRLSPHAIGVLAVTAGAAMFSLNGLLVRQIESASGFQIVVYRSIPLVLILAAMYLARHGRLWRQRLRECAGLALRAGPIQAVSTSCFLLAMTYTTVAAVMFMQGSAPLIAAALAWAVLGERPSGITLVAMLAVLAGVGVMIGDGFAGGSLLGLGLALVSALAFSSYVVLLRRGKHLDMLPAAILSPALAALACATLAPTLAISAHDLAVCLIWGTFVHPVGVSLFVLASRSLTAAEFMLLGMVEIVLGPIWAWLAVGEVPSPYTLVGGIIILAAVAAWSAARLRGAER